MKIEVTLSQYEGAVGNDDEFAEIDRRTREGLLDYLTLRLPEYEWVVETEQIPDAHRVHVSGSDAPYDTFCIQEEVRGYIDAFFYHEWEDVAFPKQ